MMCLAWLFGEWVRSDTHTRRFVRQHVHIMFKRRTGAETKKLRIQLVRLQLHAFCVNTRAGTHTHTLEWLMCMFREAWICWACRAAVTSYATSYAWMCLSNTTGLRCKQNRRVCVLIYVQKGMFMQFGVVDVLSSVVLAQLYAVLNSVWRSLSTFLARCYGHFCVWSETN